MVFLNEAFSVKATQRLLWKAILQMMPKQLKLMVVSPSRTFFPVFSPATIDLAEVQLL